MAYYAPYVGRPNAAGAVKYFAGSVNFLPHHILKIEMRSL